MVSRKVREEEHKRGKSKSARVSLCDDKWEVREEEHKRGRKRARDSASKVGKDASASRSFHRASRPDRPEEKEGREFVFELFKRRKLLR